MANRKTTTSATASRRQKQIEDCLYRCLLDTPYQSVSVVDICRQVGISRKAFYNYYRDDRQVPAGSSASRSCFHPR